MDNHVDAYYLVCAYCLANNNRPARLELDRQRLVFLCPTCGGGYTCQLLAALTGYAPPP